MAKKVNIGSMSTDKQMNDLQHLQSILTRPEALKVMKLDREIGDVIKRKNLTFDEKVKLIEETISSYKKSKSDLISKGGNIFLSQQQSDDNLENKIKEIVVKLLNEYVNTGDEGEMTTPSGNNIIVENNGHESYSTPDHDQNVPELDLVDEATITPAPLQNTTPSQTRSKMEQVKDILLTHGILQKENCVKVPIGSRHFKVYAIKTYEDMLKYLFNENLLQRAPKPQWKMLMSNVYKSLKQSPNFIDLLNKYPNLEKLHQELSFPINDWSSG